MSESRFFSRAARRVGVVAAVVTLSALPATVASASSPTGVEASTSQSGYECQRITTGGDGGIRAVGCQPEVEPGYEVLVMGPRRTFFCEAVQPDGEDGLRGQGCAQVG
ncbi:hypothetical protein ABTZ99_33030 [Actinosynnema sp. NPDC002837]